MARLGPADLDTLTTRSPKRNVAALRSNVTPEYRPPVRRHGGHFMLAGDSLDDQLLRVPESIDAS